MVEILEKAITKLKEGYGFTQVRREIQDEYKLTKTDALSFCEMALEQIEEE